MNRYSKLYWKFRIFSYFHKSDFKISAEKEKSCFIFLAADYGNLGDVAITFAQKKFLEQRFPDYDVIEVPAAETLIYLNSIKRQIRKDDIVTIVGGGNMGDMYGDLELLRLMVVKAFPKNRIICFPQTIDYSESKDAIWLKRFSRRVYSSHPNLMMMARERVSFNTMKSLYPHVNVKLTPDIVMTLDERDHNIHRTDKALLCLRDDKEKSDNSESETKIIELIEKEGLEICRTDTHIGGDRYTEREKYAALRKLWNDFSSSRIVITDRLHGMIFAYITGTPAIVLPNSNFKVRECYRWIADCGYIHMYANDCNIDLPSMINAAEPSTFSETISRPFDVVTTSK